MTTESPTAEDTRMDVGAIFGAVLHRWLRIVLVTLLLLGATYGVLTVTPKMYESYSSLLVEARDNAFLVPPTGGTGSTGGSSVTLDALISSQIELIKSRDTLLKVVDAVNLRSVPEFNGSGANPLNLMFQLIGRKPAQASVDDAVLTNLNDRLTVIRERDSAIVSIYVRSQDPKLAATIANAIAAEHVKRRADQTLQDTAEASTWLEQQITSLRDKVEQAETAVANFKSQNDLYSGANNTSLVDQQLSSIAGQISDAQQRQNAAQSRATLIRSMIDAGQPIDGLADVQSSTTIQQLSQSRAELQRQLAEKSSTLLPNHPTIRALNAQIRELDRQISAEGKRVAASFESEAKVEGDLVATLQANLAKAKQSATTAATSSVTLDQLEREAKAQRDLLESYLGQYRQAVSRTDSSSALPDVRIVSIAAPSVAPAAPKTGLILTAVGIGALALQIGAIMLGELVSGRAVVVRQPLMLRHYSSPGPGGTRATEPTIDVDDGDDDGDEPLLPFDRPAGKAASPAPATRPRKGITALPMVLAENPAAPDEGLDARVEAATEEVLAAEAERTSDVKTSAEVTVVQGPSTVAPLTGAVDLKDQPHQSVPETKDDETIAQVSAAAIAPPQSSPPASDTVLDELAAEMAEELGETRVRPTPESVAEDDEIEEALIAEPVAIVEPAIVDEPAGDTEALLDAGAADVAEAAGHEPDDEPAEREHSVPMPVPSTIANEVKDHSGRYPSPLTTLSADIALGRARVVMIAGLSSAEDCLPVSDSIVAEALYAGLTIVRVDAGSGDITNALGITDLAAEHASFGDIVHRGTHEGLAEVPWGQQMVLDRRSTKPGTLIEALADLYEVVVVITGRVGLSSTLPLFTGIDCRLVLAAVGRPSPDHLEAALADTAALGFRQAQVIVAPVSHAEVA